MIKKKICFVVSTPVTAKAFLKNHVNALSEAFEVFLVANFEGFTEVKLEGFNFTEIKDIPIERGINLKKDLEAFFKLKKYFKAMEFDVIHTVTPKAGLLGIMAGDFAGISVRVHIFTGQVWHTKTGLFKKLLIYMDKKIVARSTHILVDGESQRQFLIENNIIKTSNSLVLGRGSISGVDSNRFTPDSAVRFKVRKELDIKSDDVVFMFLGRMNIDKGILELGKAFELLSSRISNCKLLLVGADEELMLPKLSKIICNEGNLIYHGATNQPERYLQACDVFCLPSHREGFGTSIIEASLLEKPIICSDTYGLMETIIDNETGIRHKVRDVQSLTNAMEILSNDQELRMRLGKKGREYILQNFTAQQITQEWVAFYKNILNV